MHAWLARAGKTSKQIPNGDQVLKAWEVVLRFIWDNDFAGACHDTSAVLYILLSELGFSPTLNIGEVKAHAGIFDHSWVELDGLIYDAAVSLPHPSGKPVGGPVFASIDMATHQTTELIYGMESGHGFGPEAVVVVPATLAEFANMQPTLNIWFLSVLLAGRIGVDLTFAGVEKKYGSLKRTIRLDSCTQ